MAHLPHLARRGDAGGLRRARRCGRPRLTPLAQIYIDIRDYDYDALGKVFYDTDFEADMETAFLPLDDMLPLRRSDACTLRGHKYICPAKPENILAEEYGPTWRTPSHDRMEDVNARRLAEGVG